jgi:stress-induced-phosphoprotein 1
MKDASPKFTPVEVPEEAKQHFEKKEATPEPEDDDVKAKKEAKEKADAEKALGTENYKKRQFDAAIEHYSKAWELHKDITYLNNLAAAKFEKGDYEGCIAECKRAIEEGREMRADFKLIAKQVLLETVM